LVCIYGDGGWFAEEIEVCLASAAGFGWLFGAAAAGLVERNAGVDAEVRLDVGGYSEKICDDWVEVAVSEDRWVAEDVHQESVGAVGTVQLHPLPIGAGADTAMCGVSLGKAAMPVGVSADSGVAWGVKVTVAGLLVATKDDAGLSAGGLFV